MEQSSLESQSRRCAKTLDTYGNYFVLILVLTLDLSRRGQKEEQRWYSSMYGHTYSKSIDQPGKVASPARGQLNREN